MSEEKFVVVPATAGGLESVAAALARKLEGIARRPEGHCFIVSALGSESRQPYVQGMTGDELVYLEAANLGAWPESESENLTPEEAELLNRLGWRPPESGDGNFFREEDPNWIVIAALVVTTLAAAYGTSDEQPIELDLFPREHQAPTVGKTR